MRVSKILHELLIHRSYPRAGIPSSLQSPFLAMGEQHAVCKFRKCAWPNKSCIPATCSRPNRCVLLRLHRSCCQCSVADGEGGNLILWISLCTGPGELNRTGRQTLSVGLFGAVQAADLAKHVCVGAQEWAESSFSTSCRGEGAGSGQATGWVHNLKQVLDSSGVNTQSGSRVYASETRPAGAHASAIPRF